MFIKYKNGDGEGSMVWYKTLIWQDIMIVKFLWAKLKEY